MISLHRFGLIIGIMGALALSKVAGAQSPVKKITEFRVAEVKTASLDRLGNLYLVLKNETLRKYDTDGNFLHEYSNPGSMEITLLEPWNPLRVFVYGRKKQEILLLDHSLERLEKTTVEPSLAVEPILVSPTSNNFYWILDGADNTLKKIDSRTTSVMQEVKLTILPGSTHQYSFLREYQNLLFLVDQQQGIEILSVVGKPIRSFQIKRLRFLGFLGQEIYYLDDGKIKLFDLYTEEQRVLPADARAQIVLLTDERMVVVKDGIVEIWEYKP